MINLYYDLVNWTYEIWRSICFIQNHPIKREVFAWTFRDRIVHHLIYNRISPIYEQEFIYDSYSCRKWKWTSMWVKRISKFIRSCSENYTKDCYVLKLDIQGYFMSISRDILWDKVKENLHFKKSFFVLYIIHKIIYNDCTKNSIFKWKREDYIGLPKTKSLFYTKPNCGLPIWNLTSQLFSNVYLSDFDLFVKQKLRIKYYWRYVDDFILVHKDKEYLKSLIPEIWNYLETRLWLVLHPKKIYLQHYTKGVLFLWSYLKPHRIYIRKRTIWYFYEKIQILNDKLFKEITLSIQKKTCYIVNYFNLFFRWNKFIYKDKWLSIKLRDNFLSTINSYLWFMKHYKTYKKRNNMFTNLISWMFWNYFDYDKNLNVVKKKSSTLNTYYFFKN
jgi:hypothetical protein